jgi:hypothetical protein
VRLPGVEIDGVRTARRQFDAYYTPEAAIRALIDDIKGELTGPILDPCVGDGAILRAFLPTCAVREWMTNDFDVRVRADTHRDASTDAYWEELHDGPACPDWVITNPPWSQASEITSRAIVTARCGVAMLLRLSFLEPTRNREWISRTPPDRVIVLPRISYTTDGKTDTVTSAWMIWCRDYLSKTGIRIVSREELLAWGYRPTRTSTASAV